MSSILADQQRLRIRAQIRGEVGGVAGSQPMSTAVHMSPNKLWRSNSIFNLCAQRSLKVSTALRVSIFVCMVQLNLLATWWQLNYFHSLHTPDNTYMYSSGLFFQPPFSSFMYSQAVRRRSGTNNGPQEEKTDQRQESEAAIVVGLQQLRRKMEPISTTVEKHGLLFRYCFMSASLPPPLHYLCIEGICEPVTAHLKAVCTYAIHVLSYMC